MVDFNGGRCLMKKYNIGDLILRINSNAKAIIHGDNIDTCTIEWLDGTNPISKSDIKNIISTYESEIEEKEKNQTNKKKSGKQKLKDLGLDDDEIQALIG
jgi:hypothetical protein